MAGNLSSVNLIAGAGILGNVGGVAIIANAELSNNISTYSTIPVVYQFANVVSTGNSVLNSTTMTVLQNLSGNIFPAVTDAIPSAYISSLGNTPIGGLTSLIITQSQNILGNGDLGKFEQVIGLSQGYVQQTNQLIATSVNASSGNVVYVSQDVTSTGGLSQVTQAFSAFSKDLANLGSLIDLSNLNNLGSPAALLQQVVTRGVLPAGVATALLESGVSQDVINNIETNGMTDSQQKNAYIGMTKVTGSDLTQVLATLNVNTTGIATMADLLNPVKIFPNSFQTLTVLTANGIRGIYVDNIGTVNSLLETELPQSVLAPLQGNPLQNNKAQQI